MAWSVKSALDTASHMSAHNGEIVSEISRHNRITVYERGECATA